MLVEISKIEPEKQKSPLENYWQLTSAFMCASLRCWSFPVSSANVIPKITPSITPRDSVFRWLYSLEITFEKVWAQESVKTSKHVKTVSMNICTSTHCVCFVAINVKIVQQAACSALFWLPDRDFVFRVFMRGCFAATTPSNPHETMWFKWSSTELCCHEALAVVFSNTLPIACYSNSDWLRFLPIVKPCEICHSPSASLVASGGDSLDVPDPVPFQAFQAIASNWF